MQHHTEILVLGGGIIGLAIALELRLRGRQVTVLSRNNQEAATQAAGGMLAPQAEELAPGPMLDFALQSRDLYREWTAKLESLTGGETGYWDCGILAPKYQAVNAPSSPTAQWLDRAAIQEFQPGLGAEIEGGWWFPQDAQVDNRAVAQTLKIAVREQGVQVWDGVTVEDWQRQGQQVTGVVTAAGTWTADQYVLATGAWAQELLPVPVVPRKGQMLAVRVPGLQVLQRVLFGPGIYIIPRRDGRIVVGATSEDVGFAPHNTPAGIQTLVNGAIRLYPALKDLAIEELWWGFRPATPDELPILGASPYENLTLAVGHYRNGILLAPATAQAIATWIEQRNSNALLSAFHYSRFKSATPKPI